MVVVVVALVLGGGSVWSNMCPVIWGEMAMSGEKLSAVRELPADLFASFANKILSPVQ